MVEVQFHPRMRSRLLPLEEGWAGAAACSSGSRLIPLGRFDRVVNEEGRRP